MSKAKRRFKFGRYGYLKSRALRRCTAKGHDMVLATTWRWREKDMNEKFFCRHCHMELFIQFQPPDGFNQVHGTAPYVTCTFDPDKDAIVNLTDEVT